MRRRRPPPVPDSAQYGNRVTAIQVLAWESSIVIVDDVGHGLGALITSPAAAGFAALGAAWIAAREVRRTRNTDKAVARASDRWQRFEWVSVDSAGLDASTRLRLIVLLEQDATRDADSRQSEFFATVRRRVVLQAASRSERPGVD